jgi:D-sedoheptulose 7-phosphate isomerase
MSIFERATRDAVATLQGLAPLAPTVEKAAELIGSSLVAGGKLLVCGNGGSAGDAADFTTEFTCRYSRDRQPFPAINLAACGSVLTATGNDYGFEQIFARQVRAFARPGDVVVGISTSGNSANILAALKAARELGIPSIAMLGLEGGKARGLATLEFLVPSPITARVQEAHKFLFHVLCEMIDERWLLRGDGPVG